MAQRTGADSRLAPKATAASSRIILALAVSAALFLGGCGGGGDSQEQGSSAATATEQASGADNDGASKAAEKSSSGSKAQGSGATGAGKPGSSASTQDTSKPSAGGAALPTKGREKEASPAEEAQATVADIPFSSPDLELKESLFAIPSTYTCDGKNTWPTLEWETVPSGSEELLIFVMNVQPVEGRLFFDWAVAGIDPSTQRIEAGKLPPGAVQGQNGFGKRGYEICPPKGSAETYIFTLYAIPTQLSPRQGFDSHALREEALGASGSAGILAATYGR